jgi:AraC-like DNA-binding protein
MPSDFPATSGLGAPCGATFPAEVVEDEQGWRLPPRGALSRPETQRITVTRWRALEERTREVSAETDPNGHLVAIVLRNENIRLSIGGHIVHDGPATPGMLQVTEPALAARCLFRGPYDVLHLHVPNTLIAEFNSDICGREAATLRTGATPTRDPVMEPLGRALLAAEEVGDSFAQLYADSISNAILARLIGSARRPGPSRRPKAAELARWRLKRAIDYVDAHLGDPVSLSDIASMSGLSRMHFAAQFRASTGLRPHEYLLRRRIERAQEMLAGTNTPVVDIALAVGFQTQSHFTTVFKRFAGQPPLAWRQIHRNRPILVSAVA